MIKYRLVGENICQVIHNDKATDIFVRKAGSGFYFICYDHPTVGLVLFWDESGNKIIDGFRSQNKQTIEYYVAYLVNEKVNFAPRFFRGRKNRDLRAFVLQQPLRVDLYSGLDSSLKETLLACQI